MNKFLSIFVILVLAAGLIVVGVLYKVEFSKNALLRSETSKTYDEAKEEVVSLKEELKNAKEKYAQDNKRLFDEASNASREKEEALKDLEEVKKSAIKERDICLGANEDLEKLRKESSAFKKDSLNELDRLKKTIIRNKRASDTKILSLEAQLAKATARFHSEAERYHYNLGVVYSQNKEYDTAVKEFKSALGFNPNNAKAYFNLGVIYDDYFKDKDNARINYRAFLELSPASDDAESVREWLANLDKRR